MRGLDLLKALQDLAGPLSSCSFQAKYQVLITDVTAGSYSVQGSGTHPAPGLVWCSWGGTEPFLWGMRGRRVPHMSPTWAAGGEDGLGAARG